MCVFDPVCYFTLNAVDHSGKRCGSGAPHGVPDGLSLRALGLNKALEDAAELLAATEGAARVEVRGASTGNYQDSVVR